MSNSSQQFICNDGKEATFPMSSKVDGKKIAQQKREKFRRKQQKKLENAQKSRDEDEWLQKYSNFIARIELSDVKKIKELSATLHRKYDEPLEQASRKRQRDESSSSTSRLAERLIEHVQPYMNLKENNKDTGDTTSFNGRRFFIAEGTETVRMLLEKSALDQSTTSLAAIRIHSILTKPSTFFEDPVNLRKSLMKCYPSYFTESSNEDLNFKILIASEKAMTDIVGFPVSRGAMACGMIPHYDESWLDSYLKNTYEEGACIRILALDNICDTANLGSLIRSSAAFGIHAVVLSNTSCDVWYRRCVRVSMGHALSVPSIRVRNLSSTLQILKSKYQINNYAAVIDKDADMVLENIKKGGISKNWCCVLGNEGNGLSKEVAASCDHTIRIEMVDSVDSLSVGVAAGILLHGMKERENASS